MINGLDHVQLAMPAGAEERLRVFYCDVLGMTEVAMPKALRGRGGFWTRAGKINVHFGIDPDFHPATKAHPAFLVRSLDKLADQLSAADHKITWDEALPRIKRFFTYDPVGNRIEFIAQS